MAVDEQLLASLGLSKGDEPLDAAQLRRRLVKYEASIWPTALRHDPRYQASYQAWMAGNADNIVEAEARYIFNNQLAAYRKASKRLAETQLSVGREAQYETRETGELDPDTYEPLTEEVLVSEAVEPEAATVEQPIRDPETGEITGTEEVPNPAIVKDDEERAAAQAVIDQFTEEQIAEFQTYLGDTNG